MYLHLYIQKIIAFGYVCTYMYVYIYISIQCMLYTYIACISKYICCIYIYSKLIFSYVLQCVPGILSCLCARSFGPNIDRDIFCSSVLFWIFVPIILRVEFLLKSDSGHPNDAGVISFTMATPGSYLRFDTHWSASPVSALARSGEPEEVPVTSLK